MVKTAYGRGRKRRYGRTKPNKTTTKANAGKPHRALPASSLDSSIGPAVASAMTGDVGRDAGGSVSGRLVEGVCGKSVGDGGIMGNSSVGVGKIGVTTSSVGTGGYEVGGTSLGTGEDGSGVPSVGMGVTVGGAIVGGGWVGTSVGGMLVGSEVGGWSVGLSPGMVEVGKTIGTLSTFWAVTATSGTHP